MKVGDLVKSIPRGYLGIVIGPATKTMKLWKIHWINKGMFSLRPESQVEVINESR